MLRPRLRNCAVFCCLAGILSICFGGWHENSARSSSSRRDKQVVTCHYKIINPDTQKCHGNFTSNQIACYRDQSLCGNDDSEFMLCYYVNTKECHLLRDEDGDFTPKVCFKGQSICGRGRHSYCYNPNSEECITVGNRNWEFPLVCPKGQTICGDSYCMDPAVHTCLTSGNLTAPCHRGHRLCGSFCYNHLAFDCFHGGKLAPGAYKLCRVGHELCEESCFDPDREDCVVNKWIYPDTRLVCPVDWRACNGKCFDPAKNDCSDGVIGHRTYHRHDDEYNRYK